MGIEGLFGNETQPHLVDSIKFISIESTKYTNSVKTQVFKKKY